MQRPLSSLRPFGPILELSSSKNADDRIQQIQDLISKAQDQAPEKINRDISDNTVDKAHSFIETTFSELSNSSNETLAAGSLHAAADLNNEPLSGSQISELIDVSPNTITQTSNRVMEEFKRQQLM